MSDPDAAQFRRRYPCGAELCPDGQVDFRVWAPDHSLVRLVLESCGDASAPQASGERVRLPMRPDGDGYFRLRARAPAGTLYRYQLGDDPPLWADPASRFQPQGPLGPSQVVDPAAFAWTDAEWPGVRLPGQVLYEMHVGTFTPEGTWQAAARELPELARLGVTLLEILPVADFAGQFGWGYDGVDLFAPTRLYGPPDDLRAFINTAHALGLGVVLDVVYHRVGFAGNVLFAFAKNYFTDRYANEWGNALNFDGPQNAAVREFVLANAGYWIEEFHFDGYRIDATQAFGDASPEHILRAVTRCAREAAARRSILVIAENERQDSDLVRSPQQGGCGMDALWCDDFHHAAKVRLTGRREGYYSDYRGTVQELVDSARWSFLFQGQWCTWQGKPRGTPAGDLPAATFIHYLQNHDQVANSARGDRLHRLTGPGQYRAMTALWLLMPQTPLLFQGQEFAADSPFLYFADNSGEAAASVREGRRRFLSQFISLAEEEMQAQLADPADPATFARSKLDFRQRREHAQVYDLHADLLRLRREDAVFAAQDAGRMHGATLGNDALVLRWLGGAAGDRLLVVNFGPDLQITPLPQPLLAPPRGAAWELLWSSESARYGGHGIPTHQFHSRWQLAAASAIVLRSR